MAMEVRVLLPPPISPGPIFTFIHCHPWGSASSKEKSPEMVIEGVLWKSWRLHLIRFQFCEGCIQWIGGAGYRLRAQSWVGIGWCEAHCEREREREGGRKRKSRCAMCQRFIINGSYADGKCVVWKCHICSVGLVAILSKMLIRPDIHVIIECLLEKKLVD